MKAIITATAPTAYQAKSLSAYYEKTDKPTVQEALKLGLNLQDQIKDRQIYQVFV